MNRQYPLSWLLALVLAGCTGLAGLAALLTGELRVLELLALRLALVGGVGLFALLLAGAGAALMRRGGWSPPPAEKFLAGAALGLALFALGQAALLAAGIYHAALAWGALGLLLLACRRTLPARLREIAALPAGLRLTTAELAPALAIALYLALNLFYLVTPPVFYDTLVDHLALPGQWVLAGSYSSAPHNLLNFYPNLMETLLTFIVALPPLLPAAAAVNYLFVLLLYGALAFISVRLWRCSRLATLLIMAFIVSLTGFNLLTTVVKNDCATIFYELLALAGLGLYLRDGQRPHLVLAVAAGGLALLCKYTALYFYAALLAGLLVHALRRRTGWPAVAGAAAVGLLLFAPLALRNFAHTGNPVYPALPGIFGYAAYQPEETGTLAGVTRDGLAGHAAIFIAMFNSPPPWYCGSFSEMGPVAGIAFAAGLAAMAWLTPVPRLPLFACLALFFGAWSVTAPATRYAYAGIFFVITAAGLLLDRALRYRLPRRLLVVLVPLAALLGTANYLQTQEMLFSPFRVCLGTEPPDDFLARSIDVYPLAQYANRALPPTAKILFFGESRHAYFQRECLVGAAEDKPLLPALLRAGDASAASFARHLRDRGVTHLLVNYPELFRLQAGYPQHRLTPAEDELLTAFLLRHCRTVARAENAFLYELP